VTLSDSPEAMQSSTEPTVISKKVVIRRNVGFANLDVEKK